MRSDSIVHFPYDPPQKTIEKVEKKREKTKKGNMLIFFLHYALAIPNSKFQSTTPTHRDVVSRFSAFSAAAKNILILVSKSCAPQLE